MKSRCPWAAHDELLKQYHDGEWGVPVHDDARLFEFLILEGAQAGLSWLTVLRKRENYRRAFDGFDPAKIVLYDRKKVEELLHNEGIIRNRLKIESAIVNARTCLKVRDEWGTFDSYIWRFTAGATKQNEWGTPDAIPATTAESDAMSKDLGKRGFKFVGSTICYAFMQAVGMVNDHITDCFRHGELMRLKK